MNFVYDHPSINALADFAVSVAFSTSSLKRSTTQPQDLDVLLSRYTSTFLTHVPSSLVSPEGDTVLITGTTGGLGCAVLANLVESASVRRIFALNRPSSKGEDILHRQREALKSRGYDAELASSEKLLLLEGHLTISGLGISDSAVMQEVRIAISPREHHAEYRVRFANRLRTSFT